MEDAESGSDIINAWTLCATGRQLFKPNNIAVTTGEILSSLTHVAGHVMLLNSLDWTNTGISFIFLTVNL